MVAVAAEAGAFHAEEEADVFVGDEFGVKAEIYGDSVRIYGGIKKPEEEICGHDDHRIVMACSVLLSLVGGTVCGAEAVNKSYPGFFDDISSLGIKIKEIK